MPQLRSLHTVNEFKEPAVRMDYLPAGIAFIVLLVSLVWTFLSIQPSELRDFLFPGAFLPLVPVVFFFLGSGLLFITLNLRRSFLWASCLTILIWLQFQHVLDPWLVIYVIFPFAFLEIVLTVLRER